jgi:hypothetical protein
MGFIPNKNIRKGGKEKQSGFDSVTAYNNGSAHPPGLKNGRGWRVPGNN